MHGTRHSRQVLLCRVPIFVHWPDTRHTLRRGGGTYLRMHHVSRPWYRDLFLIALTTLGFFVPIAGAVAMLVTTLVMMVLPRQVAPLASPLLGLAALVAYVMVVRKGYRYTRTNGMRVFERALDILAFVWLPIWGLVINHTMLNERCIRNNCSGDMQVFRAFAEPWVLAPLGLHIATSLAYAVSKRRPEALRPHVEALVLAGMTTGVALQCVLALQLGATFMAIGLIVFPLGLPVIMPLIAVVLLFTETRARLLRRGAEEQSTLVKFPRDVTDVYRHVELPIDSPEPVISRTWLARAVGLSPVILGVYAVISAVLARRLAAGALALTETCTHTFSTLSVQVIERNCHYLCTVAARGHTWLVQPERIGVRNGTPIVVNRQLALANAFEDLLHQRWPRFGRMCRAIYDRVGLPVSRYITSPWMSDLVYLAMKPAEWLFYTALLLLDRDNPEKRIDRMYR
jgi:hypothetical protein